jgi:hypothetical protein
MAWLHVPALEQVSVVHASPSSHEATPQQMPPTQLPLAQVKPALHAAPLGCFWQVLPTQLLPPEGSELDGAKALQSPVVLEHVVLH